MSRNNNNVDKLNEALAVALAALRQLDAAAKALVLTDRRDDGHLYHDRVSTALSKIGELGRCTYSVKDDA